MDFLVFSDDVVLGLTTAGTVKVWTLQGNETKAGEPYYENESKQIRCTNALAMLCCAYNQRTVLIVCPKYWQVSNHTLLLRGSIKTGQVGEFGAC